MSVERKKQIARDAVKRKHGCVDQCVQCIKKFQLIDSLYDAGVPSGYWLLNMDESFTGNAVVKEVFDDYTQNIEQSFIDGRSICLAGNHGIGKTLSACCILKKALVKGYSACYITANDIFNYHMEKREDRDKFKDVDFLVVDELDSRFFTSDSIKEIFTGIFENIFRFRTHNMMPTIICTNEISGLGNVFYGAGKPSMESLIKQYVVMYPLAGKDFRGNI